MNSVTQLQLAPQSSQPLLPMRKSGSDNAVVGPGYALDGDQQIALAAALELEEREREEAMCVLPPTASGGVRKNRAIKNDGTLPREPRLLRLPVARRLQQLAAANCSMSVSYAQGCFTDEEHEVWTCGQNSYGELAQGDTTARKVPVRVESLVGKDVVAVAAGNEHTIILTDDGSILTAGYNDNGQCGHGSTARVGQLTALEKLRSKGAVQVHAYNGCEHTLVVLGDGRLVSFGYNYRGQLGHGNTASEPVPKLVRGLENKRVRLVSCSYYHSVVACESSELYSFGRNDFGQLGHGDTTDKSWQRVSKH